MALRTFISVLSVIGASAGSMILHERRAAAPAGFIRQGAALANDTITLRVALTSNNVVVDFDDEVKAFVQPSSETVSAFSAFASANNLTSTVTSPNGDWVSITLPPSTDLSRAQLSVSLPSQLVGHVDVLHPTTAFVVPPARLVRRAPAARGVSRIERQYNTRYILLARPVRDSDHPPPPNYPALCLVTGYVREYPKYTDLAQFLTLFRPDMSQNTTFELLSVDGGTNPQGPLQARDEANLDIQYATGLATGVPIQFSSAFIDGLADPPTVMTTSYGDTESSYGASTATKLCNGYMALGARGISAIFSSGDGGVCGNHDEANDCADNVFQPAFPASCPFITSVGGTQGFAPEVALNFSGGGFSNYFSAPAYQTAAVASFLAGLPGDFVGTFNRSGRGYPDCRGAGPEFRDGLGGGHVARQRDKRVCSRQFAAVVALINDRLVAVGKPILGFLNPFLYSEASAAFTDITIGHNSGLNRLANASGFDAAVGWDPLTGFGSPRFADLLAAALA
ncbi:subtilisin-like protein [Mycena olivaceomarginata]|nr:subtilisin-like protein [Mycena olivaceomarginata]